MKVEWLQVLIAFALGVLMSAMVKAFAAKLKAKAA
jgi:hypothetical protein